MRDGGIRLCLVQAGEPGRILTAGPYATKNGSK
jgi:hypothetical protein